MTRRIVEETQRISIGTLRKLKIFDVSAKIPIDVNGKLALWITTALEWDFPTLERERCDNDFKVLLYLDKTKPHFWWTRRRFFCPVCNERCGDLYYAHRCYYYGFACRNCEDLCYKAQTRSTHTRFMRLLYEKNEKAKKLLKTVKCTHLKNWKKTKRRERYCKLSRQIKELGKYYMAYLDSTYRKRY